MIEAAHNRINSQSAVLYSAIGVGASRWPNYCDEAGDRDASLRSANEVGLWPVPRECSRRWVTKQFWQSLCRQRAQATQETVVKFVFCERE